MTETKTQNKNIAHLDAEAELQEKGDSLWLDALKRLSRNYLAVIGLLIIIVMIILSIFAEPISKAIKPPASDALPPYAVQVLEDNNAAPQWVIDMFPVMTSKDTGGYVTVSNEYPLGADNLGRDILTRILYGARISLAVAFVGPMVALLIGISMGLLAGYFGGAVDNIVMRVVDVFYAFPSLLLIILMMAYFRGSFSEPPPTPDQYPRSGEIIGLPEDVRVKVTIKYDGKTIKNELLRSDDAGIVDINFIARNFEETGEYTFVLNNGKEDIVDGTFTITEETTREGTEFVFEETLVDGPVTFQLGELEVPGIGAQISFTLAELDRAMGGMFFIFVGIGLTSWVGLARLTRGQVLSVREEDYILAARSVGGGRGYIMWKHVLPNIMGPIIVAETLTIPSYIRYEAFLSFIGLGVNRPTPSWGSMIADGSQTIASYPYQALFPAVALFLVMFAFNFLGDGLRDALDPRMRGVD